MDSRRYGTETCSCLIPHAACSHVLAVKTVLRMDTGKKSLASTNVGLLGTKARGKANSGRKQPRSGDIKVVIPKPILEMDEPENEEELVDIAIASENEHVPEQVQTSDSIIINQVLAERLHIPTASVKNSNLTDSEVNYLLSLCNCIVQDQNNLSATERQNMNKNIKYIKDVLLGSVSVERLKQVHQNNNLWTSLCTRPNKLLWI